MKYFISHIHEESPLASALKALIEEKVPGGEAWVSAVDIQHGQQWLASLDEAIADADAVLVLCSATSVKRPWINFEGGVGQGRRIPVIPICHSDMSGADLPFPLSALQCHDLFTIHDLRRVLGALSGSTDELDAAWSKIRKAQASIDYTPPARQPLPSPAVPRSILLDGAHGQKEWPLTRRGTLFDWPRSGFGGLVDDNEWEIRLVERADEIRASDMKGWKAMIVAMPRESRMMQGTIAQIVEWVRAGGRLLLLGFELGDLHHDGNLNELATAFGLRFHGDMVAPVGWSEGKPYDKDIPFTPSSDSEIFNGVRSVVWRNVQTIAQEPGTSPLMTVGSNSLVMPTPKSVAFTKGHLVMPSPDFVSIDQAGWLPVLAQATPHLTGAGAVLACGSWDLLPECAGVNDNQRLVTNLLGWLVGD